MNTLLCCSLQKQKDTSALKAPASKILPTENRKEGGNFPFLFKYNINFKNSKYF